MKFVECPECKGHGFKKPTKGELKKITTQIERATMLAGYGQPVCPVCEGGGEIVV